MIKAHLCRLVSIFNAQLVPIKILVLCMLHAFPYHVILYWRNWFVIGVPLAEFKHLKIPLYQKFLGLIVCFIIAGKLALFDKFNVNY